MDRSPDVIVIGRGPAGLLVSSLVVEQGGQVAMVANGQGSLPLWGGQFDFRNYDDNQNPVDDPWAWWQRPHNTHLGATVHPKLWSTWWQHLRDLWSTVGIPIDDAVPAKNRRMITPLGHMKPVFLAPTWHFTQERARRITLVGIPDLVDFPVDGVARFYEATTGQAAKILWMERAPSWREGWSSLDWAWYLDTEEGRQWLVAQVKMFGHGSSIPLVFPQILGVDSTELLIRDISNVWGGLVAETPLPPPSVGGLRIQRRWERWLRRKGMRLIQGRVTQAGDDFATLGNGQRIHGGSVVLATGGVLGGGLEVAVDGTVRDTITNTRLGLAKDPQTLATLGYRSESGSIPVVGSVVDGCDFNRHGDSGAMLLLTGHKAFSAVSGQEGRVPYAGRI